MNDIFKRRKGARKKYSTQLRAFALTLNFYSAKAYRYVRKTFCNFLPDPSTIRKWYATLDGQPGFTKEALDAVKCKVQKAENPIFCNLVIDEMSIKEKTCYDGNNFQGFVDMGLGVGESAVPLTAKHALVFMLVALNGHWKLPIGYFLIDSLNGKERASLLEHCLQLVHETGAMLHSLTFDGTNTNLCMCTNLGANFKVGEYFKPYFLHPVTKEKVFCFWDPCHMLKLVRNTLGDKGELRYKGKGIFWDNIVSLQKLQEDEGLLCATKLKKKHIMYHKSRMNVKLAAQTLSESVSVALTFCKECVPGPFKHPDETALFCQTFNDAFDILNVRSKFGKPKKCNMALSSETFDILKFHADRIIAYIQDLRDCTNVCVVNGPRKTGFLGFIVCLTNLFELFNVLKEKGISYLLTYKLNQDHLETFFSALTSRGGFNDNPDAREFQSSYKKLLVRHEIQASENGNCAINDVQMLFVSSLKMSKLTDGLFTEVDDAKSTDVFDHDYLSTLWSLTTYVEEVVKYINGFVVKKILPKMCEICSTFLVATSTDSTLIKLKNKGKLIFPSYDVIKIVKTCEMIVREYQGSILNIKNVKNVLCVKAFQRIYEDVFNDNEMTYHTLGQEFMNDHKTALIKVIILTYLNMRLYHAGNSAASAEEKENVRHMYTKLIHFKHQ